MRAWTLGYPPAYERNVRIPGNAKAPGGYLFRTKADAIHHAATHADAMRYGPYEIELPGTYEEAATRSYAEAAKARHRWHQTGDDAHPFMEACGVCVPRRFPELDHDLLLVEALFINPDTGSAA